MAAAAEHKATDKEYMELEHHWGAHNYHPLEAVLCRGQGVFVWDVNGKRYFDFLSAYSAVNQGHCHPKIIAALLEQAQKLTLTSRAFYNDCLGTYEKFLCEMLGYDKMLPMNTGAEAVETAVKLARRWGYDVKKIPDGHAKLICCQENFHGRTILDCSMSTDPDCFGGYGPFVPNILKIPYNDTGALEMACRDPHVCGFLVEPIQGEAGIYVPDEGYLARCFDICHRHNVLLIADEVQTGFCRTGRMMCYEHDGIKPDIVIMGKALSGGTMPISAVCARDEIMLTIKPGQHGSTFGGNPLAAKVAIAALTVLKEEKLAENSAAMGEILRAELKKLMVQYPDVIRIVRGRGLLNAVVITPRPSGKDAWALCEQLRNRGLLCKPTHEHIIRLAPPLVITREQIMECVAIFKDALDAYRTL